ncbi:efflux RND transporter periplasmic adaptor subunit [Ochrovirga pacifica]|uniref:efflux RND transporter periplasmic adaptor subunit n=1 Tax=Ochrovirga pacifica TaxID=1042376 RepID=UPI0002559D6E|nr:efflux RND transporter periplasmic adaptor subunit [Ochrovirga pacifica]
MKRVYLAASLMITTVTFVSCNTQAETAKQNTAPAPNLEVATLTPQNITEYKNYPTSIEGIVNSDVRAKVSGYVQKVWVDEGQRVHKGQTLFQLETQTLSQDAQAAKAAVQVAQVEVDKLKPLVKKGIISPVQLETAKANLAQKQANFSSISANINYATVKSQVNGYVGAINFREGSLVSPNDATPLTTISNTEKVYAFFTLNESDYIDFIQNTEGKNLEEKINNFPPVELIMANGQIYAKKGKIETASGQIDKNTGTVSFRAVFENPNQILTNGNSGKIKIPTHHHNVLVVPQAATYEQQGKVIAYKLGKNNEVSSTVIKTKANVHNAYIVASGVQEGEIIVTNGVAKLRDGMKINPTKVALEKSLDPITVLFK